MENSPVWTPHRAFGVEADAVRVESFREDPTVGQSSVGVGVGVDVEGGELPANDSEMISVRLSDVMTMAGRVSS
jgi:hypothetical protein